MDMKQLQYFVTSTDCGSFKKAADLLYTSQPHISKCIKALEEELQVELLQRKARGVELTDAGKSVYYTARRILQDAEKLAQVSMDQKTVTLKVGALSSDYLAYSLSEYIQDLHSDEVKIQYREASLTELMTDMNHRHLDIAFASVNQSMLPAFRQKLESRHLSFYPLFQNKLHLLAGPLHPCFNNSVIQEKELKSLRLIQFAEDDDFFRRDNALPLVSNAPFDHLEHRISTNSRQLVLHLLLNTDYCLLDSSLDPKLFGDSRIHSIPVESNKTLYPFGYIQNSRESLSAPAQKLLQHMKGKLYSR